MGTRSTVFPRAILAVMRGIGRDADVVLEVINGITFLTPLWLRKPRVAIVHHVHRELYLGSSRASGCRCSGSSSACRCGCCTGAPPSSRSRTPRATTSDARASRPRTSRSSTWASTRASSAAARARREPHLIFVGRLKAYKNVETLFDVLEAVPGAILDVVGEGDHRPDLEAEIERRGLGERVRMHGYVDEETKAELYGRAWVNLTASQSEGWSLTVMEAALCRTPSVALAVGGLAESVVDGETGLLWRATWPSLTARVSESSLSPTCASASARPPSSARARSRGTAPRRRSSRCCAGSRAGRRPSSPIEPPVSLNGHAPDPRQDDERRSTAAENR